jgi:hypothetical protein
LPTSSTCSERRWMGVGSESDRLAHHDAEAPGREIPAGASSCGCAGGGRLTPLARALARQNRTAVRP